MSKEHVREPWFTYLVNGTKTIEGRLNRGNFQHYQVGDYVTFYSDSNEEFICEILRRTTYPSIAEYLETEGLPKTLPSISTIEDGVKIYRQFYSEEEESQYGMLALEIKILSTTRQL